MLRLVFCLVLLQSFAWAQEVDILGYEIEGGEPTTQPAPKKSIKAQRPALAPTPAAESSGSDKSGSSVSSDKNTPASKQTGTGYLKMEDLYQTWNARKARQSFGFSPLLQMAQYDRWVTPKWGFFVGLRYQKSQDGFLETKSTTYSPASLQMTDTVTFSGTRSPTVISIVMGAKNRIWQNDWLQINWGPLLRYTHGTSVTYAVGQISRTVANVNNPNDFAMTETGLGSTTTGVDPIYSLGIKVGSEIYLRWFPNLSLCGDIVFFNQLPIKGTTDTSTSTRTYSVVAGVAQSPTSESYNTSRQFNDYGGAASTTQVGADYFNLFQGTWSIKYVW